MGNPLYAIRLGNGPKEVCYSGSIHANEWITSILLMKFIEDYADAYVSNTSLFGYSVRDLFSTTSIYIIPMLNPDGVNLVTGAFHSSSFPYRQAMQIASAYPAIAFPSGWKANIRGVDLNLQFPARWERAKEIKYAQGFRTPAPRDFVGYEPLSEPEARALYNFTHAHNFALILAYHTQGQVIYWRFANYMPPNSQEIGKRFSQVSGYALETTPAESANAGYKDWFIQEYDRPGYTIEAGIGESPLPLSQFSEIYADNLGILVLGAGLEY